MNAKWQLVRRALLALALALGVSLVAWASSVTLVVGSVKGASGAKVEVPISVRAAQQLGALQFELVYDPAVLEAHTVEKGSMPQEITVGSNVVSPGRLRVVMNAPARESISGDGTLLKALFTVKGQDGKGCELRLEQVQAWDNTKPDAPPYEMLVAVEHGKFTVTSGGAPVGLILGICGGVVLLVVVIVAVARRKPRAAVGGPAVGYCAHCGAPLAPGARFCPKCGAPIQQA